MKNQIKRIIDLGYLTLVRLDNTFTFILIVCISIFITLGTLKLGHNWGGDFAAYIMQAISIVELSTLNYIDSNSFTIENSTHSLGPVTYPWGFPLLLAPVYALFGLDILALKFIGAISFILLLFVLWFGFREKHSKPWLLCFVCLIAFNPLLLSFTNNIMTDLPFLLISTLSIVIIQKIFIKKKIIISPRLDLVLLGTCMAIAFLIRSNGILLVFTVLITGVFQFFHITLKNLSTEKNNIRILHSEHGYLVIRYGISVMVFVGIVLTIRFFLPDGGSSHLNHLALISTDTIIRNFFYYLDLPASAFLYLPDNLSFFGINKYPVIISDSVSIAITSASVFLVILGFIKRYRTEYPTIVYFVFTAILYLIWPHLQGFRFLFPILPFCISFALTGLEHFANASKSVSKKRIRTIIAFLPLIIIILFFIGLDIKLVQNNKQSVFTSVKDVEISSGPFSKNAQEMFNFIMNNTSTDSVIIFFKPRVMKLITKRQSLAIAKVDKIDLGDFVCTKIHAGSFEQLTTEKIRYLIDKGKLALQFTNKEFSCYRIK